MVLIRSANCCGDKAFIIVHKSCPVSPPCPSVLMVGTFIVARMLCRSLSWMGCVGLPTPAAREELWEAGVVGVKVGESVEVAAGVSGVVGAWVELKRAADPEEGVAAADWLWEFWKCKDYHMAG